MPDSDRRIRIITHGARNTKVIVTRAGLNEHCYGRDLVS